MTTILYQKILKKYENKNEIIELLTEPFFEKIKKRESLPNLNALYEKLNLEKELGYNYEDFIIDYKDIISRYKEPRTYYNILKRGISVAKYCETKNPELGIKAVYNFLKNGREHSSEEVKTALLDVFDITIEREYLFGIETIIKEGYCKLYGTKEKLEKFKNRYEIKYPILPRGNKFELAFDGINYIRLKDFLNK